MKRRQLRADDAVSPVVGVILLVAITVILAAGTASLALGIGESQPQPTPQVSFDIDYSQAGNGNLTFTHDGGDNVEPSRLRITADREFHPAPGNGSGSPSPPAYESLGLDSDVNDGTGGTEQWVSDEITAGTGFTVVGTSPSALGDATVRIVYTPESGDRTTTLVEWEGPAV